MHSELTGSGTVERNELVQRGLWYALKVSLALRVGTLVWMVLLAYAGGRAPVEPSVLCRSRALLEGNLHLGIVLEPWLRWDTLCYLRIAEGGYTAQPGLTVWPPLYPLLIRLFSTVFQPPLLAALLISSLAAWLAFLLLYIYISDSRDEATARDTLLLYAVYPTAFFLVAGYTESLFLSLAVGSLLLARKRSWARAGVLAALAALTRIQGLVLSIALFWEGMLHARARENGRGGEILGILISCSLPLLAFGAFALYVHEGPGAAWPWQTLAAVWGQYSAFPWEGPAGNIRQLLSLPHSPDLYWLPTAVLDLILAILVPAVLVLRRRSLPSTELIFAGLLYLIAVSKLGPDGTLVSFSRYLLVAFPFFIALSPVVRQRSARLAVLTVSLIFQAILLSMFYLWSWAG